MKNIFRFLPLLAVCAFPLMATAQSFQQDFENFPGLFAGNNPWVLANRSDSPAGGLPWFQGDPTVFPAQSGTGYVAANFLSTGGQTGTETISNWFLSPVLNLTSTGTFSFFTRSAGNNPDRIEVRLSTSDSSTNVGTTSADVGAFTTLLLTINPALLAAGNALAYPTTFTQFNVALAAAGILPGATGRIAFRYFVTNSGNAGPNGDYVGVDSLTSNLTLAVPEPSTTVLCLVGLLAGGGLVARQRRLALASARAE